MRTVTLCLRPKLENLDDRLVPAVLFVDDDKPQRGYTSIQAAVDAAAPGDTIRVFPGTYREQVRVTKDNLTLESVARRQAVITPPAGGLPATGNGILLTVTDDADGVVVDGFTVAGPAAGGSLYAGIGVGGGSSARVTDNLVTDIRDTQPSGEQSGIGILVDGADAVLDGNTIQRYQKAGIVAFGPGTVAVRDNEVTGAGPSAVIAQVGIQLSDGVAGTVSGNSVSRNVYTGPSTGDEAAGIVLFGAGPVAVTGNRLSDNQIGIAAEGQTSGLLVSGNRVSHSTTDGIRVTDSRGVLVLDNRVSDSGRYGIALLGTTTNSLVALNRVSGSGAYDLYDGTPAGSGNLFVLNRFRTRN